MTGISRYRRHARGAAREEDAEATRGERPAAWAELELLLELHEHAAARLCAEAAQSCRFCAIASELPRARGTGLTAHWRTWLRLCASVRRVDPDAERAQPTALSARSMRPTQLGGQSWPNPNSA